MSTRFLYEKIWIEIWGNSYSWAGHSEERRPRQTSGFVKEDKNKIDIQAYYNIVSSKKDYILKHFWTNCVAWASFELRQELRRGWAKVRKLFSWWLNAKVGLNYWGINMKYR